MPIQERKSPARQFFQTGRAGHNNDNDDIILSLYGSVKLFHREGKDMTKRNKRRADVAELERRIQAGEDVIVADESLGIIAIFFIDNVQVMYTSEKIGIDMTLDEALVPMRKNGMIHTLRSWARLCEEHIGKPLPDISEL